MKAKTWLLLLFVALGAHAAEEDSTPCDTVETDQQAYACAAYNKQTAERELASAFDDLIQRIADQYPEQPDEAAALSGRLKEAQALWARLRDADCKVETYASKPGSEAFKSAWNTCLAQRSDERSGYLQSLAQE